jgi:dipeptidyl aminopeptidase/acylaminoacyl peptidase
VILFQGLDDKVVPPEQSRLIVDRLKQRGIDVEYREFAGWTSRYAEPDSREACLQHDAQFRDDTMPADPIRSRCARAYTRGADTR